MAKYVTGKELRERIRNVMAGDCPRICVAFLGPNWVDQLFDGGLPQTAKVICDLQMGATVRAALEVGGAPNNEHLRHLAGYEMHAKVYLSDEGAVVSSANATAAALSDANRIEDGVWVKSGSSMHSEICRQFEERYEREKQVDQAAIDKTPIHAGKSRLTPGLTIIEALRRSTDAFQGIYFVCSTEKVDRTIREAADRRLAEEDEEIDPTGNITRSNRREYFANWDTAPTDWPALFFAVHRGVGGGIYLSKNDSSRFF